MDELLRQLVDEVISSSFESEDYIYWKSIEADKEKIDRVEKLEIYDGNSGIGILFLEMYLNTKEEIYREYLRKIFNRVKERYTSYEFKNNGFYTGKLGVLYFLEKCNYHLQLKLDLSELYRLNKDQPTHRFELLNGLCGEIISLIHLHDLTGNKSILMDLNLKVQELIEGIKIGKDGIFWDVAPLHSVSLAGFSHGLSGIAFTLKQLANYFRNSSFNYLSNLALCEENALFREHLSNWIDLRKNMKDVKDKVLSTKEFPASYADTVAWCHGAPGIGMARISDLIKDDDEYINVALEKTNHVINSNIKNDFTLCHGLSGLAMLNIEMYKWTKKDEYLNKNEGLIQKIKHEHKHSRLTNGYSSKNIKQEFCPSLFLGTSGIAYFLLHQKYPHNHQSILLPRINGNNRDSISTQKYLSISLKELEEKVNKKKYPFKSINVFRSEHLLKDSSSDQYDILIYQKKKSIEDSFKSMINNSRIAQNYVASNLSLKYHLTQSINLSDRYILINGDEKWYLANLDDFPNRGFVSISDVEAYLIGKCIENENIEFALEELQMQANQLSTNIKKPLISFLDKLLRNGILVMHNQK